MIEIKDVYTLHGKEKVKIGCAFVNKDGTLNVVLDAIPLNGKIHIKDRAEKTNENKDEVKS